MKEKEHQTLATEIIHDLKIRSRVYLAIAIIFAILCILSNIMWYCAINNTNIPDKYTLNGSDNSKVVLNNGGEVDISEDTIQ